MITSLRINSNVSKSHHLLNLVSQDSTVAASYLLEDEAFCELLHKYSEPEADALIGYGELMEHINQNY